MSKRNKNIKEIEQGNYAVADSRCTGNCMAVSDHLNNLEPTTKIINENFPNGQIIKSTMWGGVYLYMLTSTSRQAHISPI